MNEQEQGKSEEQVAKVELSTYDMSILLEAIDEQISNIANMEVSSEDWRAKYMLALRSIETRLNASLVQEGGWSNE